MATLELGGGGAAGSVVGDIVDNGALIINRSDDLTYGGVLSGTGSFTQAGTGTTTLSAANSYAGGTTISDGTLSVSSDANLGAASGGLTLNGGTLLTTAALASARAVTLGGLGGTIDNGGFSNTFSGVIGGTGGLTSTGAGSLTLGGTNTYTGATTVAAGTLFINGNQAAATGPVSVASGSTLGGIGTTGGIVTVADGGRLVGAQGQTLTMNGLVLNPDSLVDVSLATPGTTRLFNISGGGATNLTLDGVLNISGAFTPGVYRLMDYTGALTDNGLGFGTVPGGAIPGIDLFVQTSVPGQVNVINSTGLTLTYWDGDDGTRHDDGSVNGGDGDWDNTANRNWTQADGTINGRWTPNAVATFQGAPGIVTVRNTDGPVMFGGAAFPVANYTIVGDTLTTNTAVTPISVGAGVRAAIAVDIDGSGGLTKTGPGVLSLAGANTYGGGTIVTGGTLAVAADTNLGAAAGGLTLDGGTLLTTGDLASARAVTLGASGGTIDNGGPTSRSSAACSVGRERSS